MSIKITLSGEKPERSTPDVDLHHIPARINFDGEAHVREYFKTGIRQDKGTQNDETGSFRGRPLNGTKINIPEGYTGVIMKELHKPLSEDEEREFRITHEFKHFTSWNLDLPTSSNDKIQQALHWMSLATAVHGPILEEGSPKSDTSR